MGRYLSPAVRRELANLDKDPSSRKSAMKALNSYVKDMNSNEIPQFLARVSETKDAGTLSGEYTISLYEILARFHGVNIVSQIESIMETIIKTLSSSGGLFPLQQACSKVIPAIARYGIDPATDEGKKRSLIHSLCKPLLKALLGTQESLTSGAALCLKALVDCDNWRFASDEMVNWVCQDAAVALENKTTQSNSHMGLVMSLAKNNSFIVEAYSRVLINSGLRILNSDDASSQKRLSAIQMVNFLMKSLDPISILSEVDIVIETMEKCQCDPMAFVSGAAYEALQTAKRISVENCSKLAAKNSYYSHKTMSPESQTLDSYSDYDSGNDCRSVKRKLWNRENGAVDMFSKDAIFSAKNSSFSLYSDELNKNEHNAFISFCSSPTSEMGVCKIFTTPRKLIRSLQVNEDSDSENEGSNFKSSCSVKYGGDCASESDTNDESVSSTKEPLEELVPGKMIEEKTLLSRRKITKILLLVVIIACLAVCYGPSLFHSDVGHHLVPT